MFRWIKEHIYEMNYFVAGWCAFACLDSLLKESYGLALLNAVLVIINIKLAKTYE